MTPPRPPRVPASVLVAAAWVVLVACTATEDGSPPWICPTSSSGALPTGGGISVSVLGEGWFDARQLPPPLLSEGWEHGGFLTADGEVLYFAYSPEDFYAVHHGEAPRYRGTLRAGQAGPASSIFSATYRDEEWTVCPEPFNHPDGLVAEGAPTVAADHQTLAFARYGDRTDLHLVRRGTTGAWGAPSPLPAPVNSPCDDDHPHLSADGRVLWFDSNRLDPRGDRCVEERRIFRTEQTSAGWTEPTLLPGGPGGEATQPFLTVDEEEVYWRGPGMGCSGGCIWRALRGPGGTFGNPRLVLQPTPLWDPEDIDGSLALAEGMVIDLSHVSLDAAAETLVFTYQIPRGPEHVEVSLGLVQRP